MLSARLLRKTSGSSASSAANAAQIRRRPRFAGRTAGAAISALPLSEQALRPEDQDQHQEQIRQDRRDLREAEAQQLVAEGLVGDLHARRERLVDRDREGLQQADQQRREERTGERAHAADDDDDEDDRADRAR